MSEETQEEGGMSTIKKTIIGLVTTVVTGAGAYVATHIDKLFGVEEEVKTEEVTQTQQAPAPIILNVDNSSSNTNSGGGGTTVIKETKVVEKPVKEEKSESEDAPW